MRIFLFAMLFTLTALALNVVAQPVGEPKEPFTIKLKPEADINPVKTQHTIIAKVTDSEGRPLAGQRVDWILARGPQMVGDIVEQDDMGAIVDTTNEVIRKLGNHYTVSYTNEGPVTLRGAEQDISLGVGETWITITSPVEGETHIIGFCPGIKNPQRHKDFVVKYWIDAKIQWPQNAVNKVGDEHTFALKLNKASNNQPISGHLVRWTLIEEESAPPAYLDEAGKKYRETETDENGEATTIMYQEEPREGNNRIKVELLDPTGKLLAIREVTKQWLSPKIKLEKTGPAEGILGENVVFTLELTNPGAADAIDVQIKDKIEEGFEYTSCSLKPDKIEDNELIWDIGTIPTNAKKTFTLSLKAKSVGKLKNTAVVYSKEAPPQTATAVVNIGAPKVYILKSGTKEVRVGETAEYELTIKNSGDAVAKDVVIRDIVPAGMQYADRDPNVSTTLKWELGTLQPREERKIPYSLNAVKVGEYKNEAFAYLNFSKDKENKAVHKADFTTLVVAPELKLEKIGPRLMYLHRSAVYTIKIKNDGNGSALELMLTDTLPEELDFISADPRGIFKPAKDEQLASITWKIPEIAAGETKEIKLEIRAKKRGQCVNSAKLISMTPRKPEVKPLASEVSTKIIGVPAMHISTYDTEDPCEVDKQTIYVIECRNEGTSPCTNVLMRDQIPQQMEFIEAEGPSEHKWNEADHEVVFEAHPILQPGDKLTFRVRCKAAKSGSAKNRAILKYDQFEQEIMDEEGTSVYQ